MARRLTILGVRKALRRHRLDAVFWGLLLIAAAVDGSATLSGLPVMASLFTRQTPTEARSAARVAYASFITPIGTRSDHAPQVLQPVGSGSYPDWLVERLAGREAPVVARVPVRAAKPRIAIVIDDMGGDVEQSRRAIALPGAITLSFLPYPATAPLLAREAHREHHEVLVHVPMQPLGAEDPGPQALRVDLEPAENLRRLEWHLSRIADFDGINNHEGSSFTASRPALAAIMGPLAERNLFFLDSRTSPATQVVNVARTLGVQSAGRDVFLDDTDRPDVIDAQLRATEVIARERGVAIAIGHPRRNTLDALWRWCGEIRSRGFVLITVREAIAIKTERETREASLTPH